MKCLGDCYMAAATKRGTESTREANLKYSISQYEKAVNCGYVDSMRTLGDLHNEGSVFPKDPERALEYYRSGAKREM